ncbi:MAG TPA: hypothetical protein VFH83_09530, partial [Spirochaetia bacterium]|nr:hypothetical protein [Spirochaetia bacterium]
ERPEAIRTVRRVVGSSDLLIIKCQRVLQRERMAGNLDDRRFSESADVLGAGVDRMLLIEMGVAAKRRAAGPLPTVIGTLDASTGPAPPCGSP